MSKLKPKISVVVPIYNVEKYLEQCLNSVCNQTFKDIEIICVNDGSTDNSQRVIDKFKKKDKRIKCINKKNSGYGHTMNVGFDSATGEYIGIVESDDYVDKKMFEILYEHAKANDLDVVKSDYYIFYSNSKKQEYVQTCDEKNYYQELITIDKSPLVFKFKMNTWTGIYKSEFIKSNNIRHNETPGASYQDNGFWFQTIALAERLMFINKAFYHYRQDNPNSSINSKSKIFCMSNEYDFIYKFLNEHIDIKQKYFKIYFIKRFFNCMTTYNRISNENKLLFLENFSQDLKNLIEENDLKIDTLNDVWVQNMVERIIDDYKLFFYEDLHYKLTLKIERLQEALFKLQNSNELQIGHKIRNAIKRRRV